MNHILSKLEEVAKKIKYTKEDLDDFEQMGKDSVKSLNDSVKED